MYSANATIVEPTFKHVSMSSSDLMIGLLIVVIVPALFWTGVAWLIAVALGFAPSMGSLVALALGIATPPVCVWSALAVRD